MNAHTNNNGAERARMNGWSKGQKQPKGKLLVWGWNYFCQLGLEENNEDTYRPCELARLAKIRCVYIALGDNFCCAISDKGRAYSWGLGSDGQLGHNDVETGSFPREIGAIRKKTISHAACGEHHALFLQKKSGRLYSGMYEHERE